MRAVSARLPLDGFTQRPLSYDAAFEFHHVLREFEQLSVQDQRV